MATTSRISPVLSLPIRWMIETSSRCHLAGYLLGYPLQLLPGQVLKGNLVFHEDDPVVMGDVPNRAHVGYDGAIGFLADALDGGFRTDGISGYPDQDVTALARPVRALRERVH